MRLLRKLFFLFVMLALPTLLWAQAAATAVAPAKSTSNLLATLMIIISLVLAFVVYGMGQVLLTFIRQVMDKRKADGTILAGIFLVGFSLIGTLASAQEVVLAEPVKALPNYGGMDATGFWVLVSVIAIEVISILVLMFFINRMQQELVPAKIKKPSMALQTWWANINNRFFTKAVPLEKEQDILLDHDYDGIRELDNSLPPWWKYGFIITVIFSVGYMLHFHVLGSGNNPTQEYEAEMLSAAKQQEAYEAKNKDRVDENNIVMGDAVGIAAGNEIFQTACYACHGKAGEGGAGPNLTDEYWLHKGSLNEIYSSIKTGFPDKGMQAWDKQFSPKQIQNIASFIITLRGTKPANGKIPQGEVWTSPTVTDSTVTIIGDSVQKN